MMLTRFLTTFALLLTVWMGVATAQSTAPPVTPPAKSPFGVGAPSSADRGLVAGRPAVPAAQPSGPIDRAWYWMLAKQAEINRALAQAVMRLKTESLLASTLILAGLSFAYGVLHAAGPGHGKAIISSYVLANERTVRRGIYLSFLAAFVQGLMAVAMVGVLVVLLKATGLQIKRAEAWLETASWALVALVGAWLLYRKLRPLWPVAVTVSGHGHASREHAHAHGEHGHVHYAARAHDHHHDHHHNHEHGHKHRHAHGHAHVHGDDCCNHSHMPDPKALEGELSWGKAFAIVMAVGIRPCTGAIVVLIFALSQGLFWAGVFATFAMALGTAITVSALAALAVGSRDLAERFGGGGSRWVGMVGLAAGIGGSAAVMLMGVAFFFASLNGQAVF